jgi:hypothetical protein
MNSSDQDQLWREVFADEALAAVRAATLKAGMGAARARRRRRIVASAGLGSVSLVLILAAILRPERPAVRAAPVAVSPPETSSVKFISDQQLLALFPNRPVALIGPAGARKLVFLDAPH